MEVRDAMEIHCMRPLRCAALIVDVMLVLMVMVLVVGVDVIAL